MYVQRTSYPKEWLSNCIPLVLTVDVSEAIRIQALRMPPHATKGDDVSMECIYDLESDKLYSVKWYRNGHEFYRYIPSDKQKRRIYDRPGINVDVSAKVFK